MKIKKLTYDLAEDALKSVEDNVGIGQANLNSQINKKKSKSLVIIDMEQKKMMYMAPIIYKRNLFCSLLPSPVHLFFSQALEFAHSTKEIIKLFPDNVLEIANKDTVDEFLVVNEDLYNNYLIYKISAITSLIMTVESFINSIIPENFTIEVESKVINKEIIEKTYRLKQKITEIIPNVIEISNMAKYQKHYDSILQLNQLRNEFIHFKTKRKPDNKDPFLVHFEKLINLDIDREISKVKNLVNFLKKGYL